MRKICIINQKGGVGKTTTAVNLAAGLSRNSKKVLLIDLDPQGNITTCLGQQEGKDLYELLSENADVKECTRSLATNFDVIMSKDSLSKTELVIAKEGKQSILKTKFEKVNGYDYVIIDCPPSFGLLSRSALAYVSEAFIPTTTDVLGVEALRRTVAKIQEMNDEDSQIIISRIIPTMFDQRNKVCVDSLKQIQSEFYEIVSDPIRVNAKLKEAPKHNKSIFSYDNKSRGAEDYWKLVRTVVQDEQKIARLMPGSGRKAK